MSEEEWLTTNNVWDMISQVRDRVTDRKLRLFESACCRRVFHLLPNVQSRQAVSVNDKYADGLVSEEELIASSDVADKAVQYPEGFGSEYVVMPIEFAAYNVAIPSGWWGAAPAFQSPSHIIRELHPDEAGAQCDIFHDIFGNPFHPVLMNPIWLTLEVVEIAKSIYDRRSFDKMPKLAAAFMDAGCDNDDILNHCRGADEHARGCWVVDLILGKT